MNSKERLYIKMGPDRDLEHSNLEIDTRQRKNEKNQSVRKKSDYFGSKKNSM